MNFNFNKLIKKYVNNNLESNFLAIKIFLSPPLGVGGLNQLKCGNKSANGRGVSHWPG